MLPMICGGLALLGVAAGIYNYFSSNTNRTIQE